MRLPSQDPALAAALLARADLAAESLAAWQSDNPGASDEAFGDAATDFVMDQSLDDALSDWLIEQSL